MSFLTLDTVSHYYFARHSYTKILDNITFSVKEGEFVTLLGPSGCGKSTLLSMIAGTVKPTEGNIHLCNKSLEEHNITIGWLLEKDYLFPWKTVIDNMLVIRQKEIKENALTLLEKTGLSSSYNHYPSTLPAGTRQCIAFLRALLCNPDIILLDDPFSKLDYQTKLKLEEMVIHLLHSHQQTAVFATNDIDEAIALSDRIVLLNSDVGSITKIFEVPLELRQEVPLLARQHPKYQLLFDKIWQEMNKNQTRSVNKVVRSRHDL
ncbi:ATP-binding cassette domain-containing protein [Virgibacillus kekensis]|uniref:ATP-binding cassette domain-containing protein n=1 Tax=Virgibacillus kekensis TaxID=202261 RepID=A0ABV9DJN6_9BACI